MPTFGAKVTNRFHPVVDGLCADFDVVVAA